MLDRSELRLRHCVPVLRFHHGQQNFRRLLETFYHGHFVILSNAHAQSPTDALMCKTNVILRQILSGPKEPSLSTHLPLASLSAAAKATERAEEEPRPDARGIFPSI